MRITPSKNFILLIFFSIAYTSVGFMQSPIWLWSKSAGDTKLDIANSITTDDNGNVYTAGYFNSSSITFGSFVLNNANSDTSDLFIAKYGPSGNVVWAKSAGGNMNDRVQSVVSDANGNIYITGYFESATIDFDTITLTNTSALGSDIFFVKYNSAGNVVWAKSAGGSYTDAGMALAIDNTGGILLAGYFLADTISFDGYDLYSAGNYDMLLVKYDTSGNVQWADGKGGTNEDKAYAVTADPSGNVLVTGAFLSSSIPFDVDTIYYSGGVYTDIFTAKYSGTGVVNWVNSEGGSYFDEPNAIVTDQSGNVYVGGIFYSSSIAFGTDTLNNSGSSVYGDLFIAKYDNNGNSIWANRGGAGTNNDWVSSMDIDGAGNIWITGVFGSVISFDSITLNNPALFVLEYNVNGNAMYATDVAGGMGYGISVDYLDNLCIAGIVYGASINFGSNPTLNNNGVYDVVVAKLGSTAGIADVSNSTQQVIIYPNPGDEFFYIDIFSDTKVASRITIYDAMGKSFFNTPQIVDGNTKLFIQSDEWPSGVYYVQIINNVTGSYHTRRIVIR